MKKYEEVPIGFHEKNDRRLGLITKKYTSRLSRTEELELRKLEIEVAQFLEPAETLRYGQSA